MPSTWPKPKNNGSDNVAGIILAAGESQRLGRPKQLLEFKGSTFLETLINTAKAVELSPVVVILGYEFDEISKNLAEALNSIEVYQNSHWREGQSSSLRMAVEAIEGRCAAGIFFLVDQPQIPVELAVRLKIEYQLSRSPIIAPYVAGKRGNPVLFSESCFSRMKEAKGDVGGRFLFKDIEPTRVVWKDARILIDVDNQKDYQKLLSEYEND